MKKYIYALDISMNQPGIAIFGNDTKLVLLTSVDTKSEPNHQMKLKKIADVLLGLREKYPPELVLIEQGFYRFNKSTEVIFRAHGVCNYIFWDVPQVSYAPMTIKKEVVGKGNVTKDEVRDEVINLYPEARDGNYDESDAVAIAVCHFRKNKIGSF